MELAKGLPPDHPIPLCSHYLRRSLIQSTLFVSVVTNTVLTTERFISVKKPFIYQRITQRTRRYACIAIWLFSLAVTVVFYLTDPGTNYNYNQQFMILSTVIFVSLPWPIVSYSYFRRIIRNRFPSVRGRSQGDTKTSFNSTERKFLTLCLRSFIVFVVCWLLYAIYGYVIFFAKQLSYEKVATIQHTIHILAFVNSTLNPILYLYTHNFIGAVKRFKRKQCG